MRTAGPGLARLEVPVVALLALLMFAMSATVAVRQPVWSPIDEASQWVTASMVAHLQFPRIDQTILIPKDLPPPPPTKATTGGGQEGQDYQAGEPPLGFLVFGGLARVVRAAAARVGPLLGPALSPNLASVYAGRLLNSVLWAGLLLLLWICAREIEPGSLALAWGMPASLFLLRGTVVDTTRFGSDVLLAVASTYVLYLYLRQRRNVGAGKGVLLGILMGAATLIKYQAVVLFPVVGLLLLAAPAGGPALRRKAAYLVSAVGVWAVMALPWLVFQYSRYGDPTGGKVELRVLPEADKLGANPWPQVLSSPSRAIGTAALGELMSPLKALFAGLNFGIAYAVPWILLAGAVALLLLRSRAGLRRAERVVLALAVPGTFLFLLVLSLRAGFMVAWDGRNGLPAVLGFAVLATAPLLLLPDRVREYAALVAVAAMTALAVFTTVLVAQPW